MNDNNYIIGIQVGDYVVDCEMANGRIYRYDMHFLLEQSGEVIDPLKEVKEFKEVFIESGSLEWPNGYCIHADTIVLDGQLLTEEISQQ